MISRPEVWRNGVFKLVLVVWKYGQPRSDNEKGETGYDFSEEPDTGSLMYLQGATWSVNLSQSNYNSGLILFVECLVLHLDVDILVHLLHLQREVPILSLRFVDETIQSVLNDSFVPFIHCF